MFDELTRELRCLEGIQRIPVSISYDVDGYLDRQCSSEKCEFEVKIHNDDRREKARDEDVFCQLCGCAGARTPRENGAPKNKLNT